MKHAAPDFEAENGCVKAWKCAKNSGKADAERLIRINVVYRKRLKLSRGRTPPAATGGKRCHTTPIASARAPRQTAEALYSLARKAIAIAAMRR